MYKTFKYNKYILNKKFADWAQENVYITYMYLLN